MSALQQPVPQASNVDVEPTDWWEVERKFVQSHLAGKKFAAQEHVSYEALRKQATRHGWTAKRREFHVRANGESHEAEIKRRREAAAIIDTDAKDIARRAVAKLSALIDCATDISKVRAGIEALASACRLLREVEGLPPEKPAPAEPEPEFDTIPRVMAFNNSKGEMILLDPVTRSEFKLNPEHSDRAFPQWREEARHNTELMAAAQPEPTVEAEETDLFPDENDSGDKKGQVATDEDKPPREGTTAPQPDSPAKSVKTLPKGIILHPIIPLLK